MEKIERKEKLEEILYLYLQERGLVKNIVQKSCVSKYLTTHTPYTTTFNKVRCCHSYIDISKDGRYFMSWYHPYGGSTTINIFETATCKLVRTLHTGNISHISRTIFSPCGDFVAVPCFVPPDNCPPGYYEYPPIVRSTAHIQIFNICTGECVREFSTEDNHFNKITYSPCGDFILTWQSYSDFDWNVQLWNIYTGECIRSTQRAEKMSSRVTNISPCGKYIATIDPKCMICRILETKTEECVRTLGNIGKICCISFGKSADEVYLLTEEKCIYWRKESVPDIKEDLNVVTDLDAISVKDKGFCASID